jgi:poly[(R)-3-hydroxyalkanoate] polymerase subunit PhaC
MIDPPPDPHIGPPMAARGNLAIATVEAQANADTSNAREVAMAEQQAAPRPGDDHAPRRNEGVAMNAALGIDRQSFVDAMKQVADAALQQPLNVFRAVTDLQAELVRVAFGTSNVELDPADERFGDDAWRSNPIFKRIGQSYVAWTRSLDAWLESSGLDGIDAQRARFVLSILKDVAAPPNTFVGNPEALRKTFDTGGDNLLKGLRHFIDDVQHNHGYPAVADRAAFEIGRDVAATAGMVVYRDELMEVIHYQPQTTTVNSIPLVYIFSQVNRFYLGDLTPDRSLFRQLVDAGVQLFAVSWRNPTPAQRNWSLDTYTEGVVTACRIARSICHDEKVNLIGVCAGGLVTATAAGLMQARGDDSINSLSLFINILDNRPGESDFSLFVTDRSIAAQKQMVQAKGIFSERDIFEMFAMLRMEESVMSFMRSNYFMGDDPLKHPLLFWSMDYTRMPAAFQCDMLDLAKDNKLAKGELRIGGKRIELSRITYPVYVMAGSTDHITPWKACYRSTQLFGGDVQFVLTNQNHTQTISNKLGAVKNLKYWIADTLPANVEQWADRAVERPGTWRDHWVAWLKSFGTEITAPAQLGSAQYPPIDAAPGRYVRES